MNANGYDNQYVFNEHASKLAALFNSGIYLAIAIIMSCELALSLVNFIISRNGSAVIGLILSGLVVTGIWMLRACYKTGFSRTPAFGFVRIQPILAIIACIALIIGLLFLLASGKTIMNILSAGINGDETVTIMGSTISIEQNDEFYRAMDSLRALKEQHPEEFDLFFEHGAAMITIVSVVAIIITALVMTAAFKTNSVISKMKNVLALNYDEPIRTSFLPIMLYIFAGLLSVGLILSLIVRPNIGTIGSGMSVAVLILAGIFFRKVKEATE